MPNPSNPQSLNRFGYVLNNPVNLIDPSGHVCVNNGGTNDEVAMSGNCGGGVNSKYTGQLQGSPSGWISGRDDTEIVIPPCSSSICNPNTAMNTTYISSISSQSHRNDSSTEPNFDFYTEGYTWLGYLDGTFTFLENYGRPSYKHLKGVVPGGFRAEFVAGFVTTVLTDLNNPTLGALLSGAAATPETFGSGTLPAGTVGGYVGGFVTFFGISYVATRAMDSFFWAPLNTTYLPGLFPDEK